MKHRLLCLALLLGCLTRAGLALPASWSSRQAILPEILLYADTSSLDPQRILPLGYGTRLQGITQGLPAWQREEALRMAGWEDCDTLRVGAWFQLDADSRKDSSPSLEFSGSLDWRPRRELRLHLLFSSLVNQSEPMEYNGNWGDLHAGSREAWLEYERGMFSLRVGRLSLNTGPESGRSLLLSDRNSLDGYRMELRPIGGFWFSSFHLSLDDRLEGNNRYSRWLAGHRFGYTKAGHWSVALGEAILYGRQAGGPSAAALNPFVSYHAVQLNGLEANTVFHFSAWGRVPGRALLSVEVLLDDLQVDGKTTDDKEPAEWALQTDLRTALPRDLLLGIGYTRIAQRTWNSKFSHQVWLFRERYLAHPLGRMQKSSAAR